MNQNPFANDDTIIQFPEIVRAYVDEGTQTGEIIDAVRKDFKTSFGNGLRSAINFKVAVFTTDGDAVELFFAPTLSQHPKSKFAQTLASFGVMPKANDKLDLKAFRGLPVIVEIKHNEKDGIVYCNIDKMVRDESEGEVETDFFVREQSAEERQSVERLFDEDDTE
jgi:hypothetical protein